MNFYCLVGNLPDRSLEDFVRRAGAAMPASRLKRPAESTIRDCIEASEARRVAAVGGKFILFDEELVTNIYGYGNPDYDPDPDDPPAFLDGNYLVT